MQCLWKTWRLARQDLFTKLFSTPHDHEPRTVEGFEKQLNCLKMGKKARYRQLSVKGPSYQTSTHEQFTNKKI